MRILYSRNGFEQDEDPQLCIEGTGQEFQDLAIKIEESIQDNRFGEIIRIVDHDDGTPKLVLINENGGRSLLIKIDSENYLISLDTKFWVKVLDLIYPLINQKGYQFIEFNDSKVNLVEDLGLVFRAV